MCDVLVIVGPGVAVDAGLLGEIARREFAVLGVRGGSSGPGTPRT
ncbi:hypothetical protein ACFQQB_01875 [Nonomuraea rubra]